MEARQRLAVPAWAGLVLSVLGVLALVGCYFLLPLWTRPASGCVGNECNNPFEQKTGWEDTLNLVAHIPYSPVIWVCLLAVFNLPLLAAVSIVACHVGLLVHPHRTFAIWSTWMWRAGIVALVLLFFDLTAFSLPGIGYYGILFGYGLLWGGNRVFRTARPDAYAAR